MHAGLRSIGERLHIISRKVDDSHAKPQEKAEIRRSISLMETRVSRMEEETKAKERTVRERYVPEGREPVRPMRAFLVNIRYRPVQSSRSTRTRTEIVFADSPEEAIAEVESRFEEEPDYILSADAEASDETDERSDERPTRGT